MRVFIHEVAERDIVGIAHHIRKDNPRAADAFELAVKESVAGLATHPELGPRPRFSASRHPHLRFWVITRFPNYLIFYEIMEEGVDIVRVLHGAQDPARLFRRP